MLSQLSKGLFLFTVKGTEDFLVFGRAATMPALSRAFDTKAPHLFKEGGKMNDTMAHRAAVKCAAKHTCNGLRSSKQTRH